VTTLSMPTMQSKLACKLLSMGTGVPGQRDVLVAWPAAHIPVHCPAFGVAYTEFAKLLS